MGDTLGEIDLVNPDNYVERVPFEWFDHLRADHPVIWHPEPEPNHGFWAVTRYDDLTAVHMDWETYSSEVGAVGLEELDAEQREIRRSMLETDPPRHTELRKICSKRFSARGVGKYEDWIRDVARSVLDRALAKGEFDFVSEISRELPIRFLCSIFTVPQEDAPQLIEWGDQMIANQDPDLSAAVESKPRGPLQRSTIQSDVNRIVEAYRHVGRGEVSVVPEIIDRGNGRADLVYTITEGAKTPVRKISFTGNQAFDIRP